MAASEHSGHWCVTPLKYRIYVASSPRHPIPKSEMGVVSSKHSGHCCITPHSPTPGWICVIIMSQHPLHKIFEFQLEPFDGHIQNIIEYFSDYTWLACRISVSILNVVEEVIIFSFCTQQCWVLAQLHLPKYELRISVGKIDLYWFFPDARQCHNQSKILI